MANWILFQNNPTCIRGCFGAFGFMRVGAAGTAPIFNEVVGLVYADGQWTPFGDYGVSGYDSGVTSGGQVVEVGYCTYTFPCAGNVEKIRFEIYPPDGSPAYHEVTAAAAHGITYTVNVIGDLYTPEGGGLQRKKVYLQVTAWCPPCDKTKTLPDIGYELTPVAGVPEAESVAENPLSMETHRHVQWTFDFAPQMPGTELGAGFVNLTCRCTGVSNIPFSLGTF